MGQIKSVERSSEQNWSFIEEILPVGSSLSSCMGFPAWCMAWDLFNQPPQPHTHQFTTVNLIDVSYLCLSCGTLQMLHSCFNRKSKKHFWNGAEKTSELFLRRPSSHCHCCCHHISSEAWKSSAFVRAHLYLTWNLTRWKSFYPQNICWKQTAMTV